MRGRKILLAGLLGAIALVLLGTAVAAYGARVRNMPEDHTAQWQWLHGKTAVNDLKACQKCHDAHSCKTCHLADWPHPDGFLKTHGREALRLRGRGCYLCHRPTYCDPCHGGVRMPHPDGYLSAHSRAVADRTACVKCHALPECDACHARHAAHRSEGAIR